MKIDKNLTDDNISKVLNDPSKVTQIIQAGNQICVWRDNKVVWIPADKIVINE